MWWYLLGLLIVIACIAIYKYTGGSLRNRLSNGAESADNKHDAQGYIDIQRDVDRGRAASGGFM